MQSVLKKSVYILRYRYLLQNSLVSYKKYCYQRKTLSYEHFINSRRQEATRSIIVQVQSENSFNELCSYCSDFGNLVGAHHFSVQHEDEHHYILIEFSTAEEVSSIMNSSSYNHDISGVPVKSPFLWFKAAKGKKKLKPITEAKNFCKLEIIDGTKTISNTALIDSLNEAASIDDQILILYDKTKLNDLGIRMRFLAALQVQQALIGMFPEANAQPFGSSVNGFGKMGCDLDLILRFNSENCNVENNVKNESRLVFHTKQNLLNGRSQTQRQMETIGDVLHLFVPGVTHVRRILQARIPIIKYHHEHLNLEVDLSMSNMSGFYMSELLHTLGKFDERVRPLMFCIRRWAETCGLTNPSPGRWITNFSLTCLVIFFLQQLQYPILPTINALVSSAKPEDIRVTEDGINCTFGRNFQNLQFCKTNTSPVSELLLKFFEFYAHFDFQNRAISLNEGRAIVKPDHSALYIVNPLEQVLNVSKNVSLEECERLRREVRNAAWLLESDMESQEYIRNRKLENHWGVLNIFKTVERNIVSSNMFFKPRMVDIVDLFDKESQADISVKENPSKSSTPIQYNNSFVKQQVQNIKSSTKDSLKSLRLKESGAISNGKRTQKNRQR